MWDGSNLIRIYSFFQQVFSEHLLSARNSLGMGAIVMNSVDRNPCLHGAQIPVKWIQAINKIRHKYYAKIKQSGEEGIAKESLHKKVVHLFRKPWKRVMKYCAYHFPFISILLFTKMKHECELKNHRNLLIIILEIHSSTNAKPKVWLLCCHYSSKSF